MGGDRPREREERGLLTTVAACSASAVAVGGRQGFKGAAPAGPSAPRCARSVAQERA